MWGRPWTPPLEDPRRSQCDLSGRPVGPLPRSEKAPSSPEPPRVGSPQVRAPLRCFRSRSGEPRPPLGPRRAAVFPEAPTARKTRSAGGKGAPLSRFRLCVRRHSAGTVLSAVASRRDYKPRRPSPAAGPAPVPAAKLKMETSTSKPAEPCLLPPWRFEIKQIRTDVLRSLCAPRCRCSYCRRV